MRVMLPKPLLVAETDTATFWQEGYERTSFGSDPFGYAMVGDERFDIPFLWSALSRIGVEMVADVVEGEPLRKARERQFSSRSEAGRYAAQVRWGRRNDGQGNATGQAPLDDTGKAVSLSAKLAGLWTEWTDDPAEAMEGRPYRPLMNLPPNVQGAVDRVYMQMYTQGDVDSDVEKKAIVALTNYYKKVMTDPKGPPWNAQAKTATGYDTPEQFAAGLADFLYERVRRSAGQRMVYDPMKSGQTPAMRSIQGDKTWRDHATMLQSATRTSVVVSIPSSVLYSVLDDKRLKTQFESGTSRGAIGAGKTVNRTRALHEAVEYGFHPAANPERRTVYGTLMPAGIVNNRVNQSAQYGDVQLVLKPQVRGRTTFTAQDSLGQHRITNPLVPNGVVNPSHPHMSSGRRQRLAFSTKKGEDVQEHDYVETQIHGGVRLSDIDRVVMRRGAVSRPKLMQQLKEAGIPVTFEGSEEVAKAAMRLLIATREGDHLYQTGIETEFSPAGDIVTAVGVVVLEDGTEIPVPNVVAVLGRGYWDIVADTVDDAMQKERERSFGSRSEAGRYAAQVRWGNRGKTTTEEPSQTAEPQGEPTYDMSEAILTGRPYAPFLPAKLPLDIARDLDVLTPWYQGKRAVAQSRLDFQTLHERVVTKLTNHFYQHLDPSSLTPEARAAIEKAGVTNKWFREILNNELVKTSADRDSPRMPARLALAESMAKGYHEVLRRQGLTTGWDGKTRPEGAVTMEREMKEVTKLSSKAVTVTVPAKVVGSIVTHGGLKNQFDSRSSGGFKGYDTRALSELTQFGTHPLTIPTKRPVYGTVHPFGVRSPKQNNCEQYGNVQVVLKSSTHSRTTFTGEDSLLIGRRTSPLNGPVGRVASQDWTSGPRDLTPVQAARTGSYSGFYLEAQIHGGVKLADIDFIAAPAGALDPKVMARLSKAGITVKVLPDQAADGSFPVTKAAGLDMRTVVFGALEKAAAKQFSSRSAAGRYAAQVRWGTRGQTTASDRRRATLTTTADVTVKDSKDGSKRVSATFQYQTPEGETVTLFASGTLGAPKEPDPHTAETYGKDPRYGFSPAWFDGTQTVSVEAFVGREKVGYVDANELRSYASGNKSLTIGAPTGQIEITHIAVTDGWKRKGIATAMLTASERMTLNGKTIVHSTALTDMGREFAEAVKNVDAIEKARQRQFSSRSEAGRYAANIRWANRRGGQTTQPTSSPLTMQLMKDEAASLRVEMDLLAADAPAVLQAVPRINPSRNRQAYEDPNAVVFIDTRTNEIIPSARVAALHDRTIALGHQMRDEAVSRTRAEIATLGGQDKVSDAQTSAIYAKHMQAVVSEVRPVGGKIEPAIVTVGAYGSKAFSESNLNGGSVQSEKQLLRRSLDELGSKLPSDWTQEAAKHRVQVLGSGSQEASHFTPSTNEIIISGSRHIASRGGVSGVSRFAQNNHVAVVGHEYTHFVQGARPAVRVMEMGFHAHRSHSFARDATLAPLSERIKLGGREERSVALTAGKQRVELLKDEFTNGYSGRLYGPKFKPTMGWQDTLAYGVSDPKRPNVRGWNSEALTTGMEQVLTGNAMRYDKDHLAFTLGVMATA